MLDSWFFNKEVIKITIFKDITKDHRKDRVDARLLKNGTFLNKPNRNKDSLRLNIDKINGPGISISSLSTHCPLAASPTAYQLSIQTQTQGVSPATPQLNPNSPLHKKLRSSLVDSLPSNISIGTPTTRDRVKGIPATQMPSFNQRKFLKNLK